MGRLLREAAFFKVNIMSDSKRGEGCIEGMKCPKCGYHKEFKIAVLTFVSMTAMGSDDPEGGMEFGDNSACICSKCNHASRVIDFRDDEKVLQKRGLTKLNAAEQCYENYEFGPDLLVTGSSAWDCTDPLDFTRIVYFRDEDEATSSERISFHVRFNDDGSVSEAYGLLMGNGEMIGCQG